ncbi:type I secretion system permease/ATPase [Pelagibius sp. Alg239-R121]|uniref:type I secretion system permease/ATPase n=1 Tax=Pelagibius sp. Alg239-R121 TaxID=2993448 RepID=UPI0024A6D337|nr:type I secretion system permease/ATPase [Pelagibius sp. Alg239-R121]
MAPRDYSVGARTASASPQQQASQSPQAATTEPAPESTPQPGSGTAPQSATDSAPASTGTPLNTESGSAQQPEAEKATSPLQPEDLLEAAKSEWHVAPSMVDFEDPLVQCVTFLATLLQRPISAEALKAGLPHAEQRFTPELAVRAAERAGLTARVVRRPKLKSIQQVTLPCILLLKGSGACVLTQIKGKQSAEIMVPEGGGGTKTIDIEELEEQYLGYAIFARPEFKFDDRALDIRLKQPTAWFWGTLAKFWPIYSHVALASIMINCFAIASPLFIMNVYDRVVPNNAIETLWVLALGVCTVFLFEFVMRNMRTYFVDIAGKNADVIIASRLLEQLMSMKLSSKPPSTGAMANNLREFESLREFFTSGTLVAFVDLPFIFLFLGVIFLVSGPIALIPLIAVPIVIFVGVCLQIPLRKVIEKTHRESSQKHALLVETIDGLETIKATAAEGRVQRSWERFVGLTAESSGKARFLSGIATTFAQVTIQLVTVIVVIYGVHLISEGEITMGALVASTMLTGRALAPLGAIAGMLTRLQQSRVALKSLDTLMKSPVERDQDKTFLHRPRLSGEIEFKKINFNYPNQEPLALDNLSFKVKPGEKIGILGRIGSGKSTIARLLLGLYEPTEGSVLMDGTDLRQIDPADLRRNIGYVSQDNYLFFGSVRENISFGAPHVDDKTILRAAAVAGVSDFLRAHPHGFDLQVGERGMALSGGQRQAVVIARSLLLDPPIILMDEPTSGMDNSTEAMFKNRLGKAMVGKTLLLVTHRSSLLSLVDRLIILDNGKIVADGKKEEVLEALKQGRIRAGAN